MARAPYQPSLLRLTHGVTALLVLAAWLSGLFVYSRYDGRWGRLPFTPGGNWIDLHGTAGFLLLPLGLAFAAYSLHLVAWLLIGLAVVLHVGDSLRLGGTPLLASMASTTLRPGDRPGDWPEQVRRFLKRGR
jgi:uncharacterized iron-regulated membrane protein